MRVMLILFVAARGRAPLAQLAEQLTLNQWVPGSSPGGCTENPSRTLASSPGVFFIQSRRLASTRGSGAAPLEFVVSIHQQAGDSHGAVDAAGSRSRIGEP